QGKQRKRDQASQEPGNHDLLDGTCPESLHGVNLLSDFHGPDFRCNTGADPSCHEKTGENRTHLAEDRERHDLGHVELSSEALEPEPELKRHDRSGRETGNSHEEKRLQSDRRELLDQQTKIEWLSEELLHGL